MELLDQPRNVTFALGRLVTLSLFATQPVDIPTIMIVLVSLALLWTFKKKLPEPLLVIAAAIVGLILYPLTHA
jgi:hypothetical protein